jgi:hypothetical protein
MTILRGVESGISFRAPSVGFSPHYCCPAGNIADRKAGEKSGLENEMSSIDWHAAPPMTDDQRRNALADMELIACGEEFELPWRRVRILLDHKLAVVQHPVLTAGSRTSLGLTDHGLRLLDAAGARQTNCA